MLLGTAIFNGLPVIIELDEAVSIFDHHFVNSSISFEELLQVTISCIGWNATDINTLVVRHFKTFIEKMYNLYRQLSSFGY